MEALEGEEPAASRGKRLRGQVEVIFPNKTATVLASPMVYPLWAEIIKMVTVLDSVFMDTCIVASLHVGRDANLVMLWAC